MCCNQKFILLCLSCILLFSSSFSYAKGTKRFPLLVSQQITRNMLAPGEQAKYSFNLENIKDKRVNPDQSLLRFTTDEVEIMPDFVTITPENSATCWFEQKKIFCSEITVLPQSKTTITFAVKMTGDESGTIEVKMDFRKKIANKSSYKDKRETNLTVHRLNPVIRTYARFTSKRSLGQPIGTYTVRIKNYSAINFLPEYARLEIKTDDMNIKPESLSVTPASWQDNCSIVPNQEKLVCSNFELQGKSEIIFQFDLRIDPEEEKGTMEGEVKLKSSELDYRYKTEWEDELKVPS